MVRSRPVYLLLLVVACLVQLGIVANIRFWWSLPLAVLVSGGILWYLKPVLLPRIWRLFVLLALVNIFALGLFAWTAGERTHITVHVDTVNGSISAQTNEDFRTRVLTLPTNALDHQVTPRGGIGLYLEDRRSERTFFDYPNTPLGSLAAAIDASYLPPAWDNIVVRDNRTGEILWQSNFDNGTATGWNGAPDVWEVNNRGEYAVKSNGWTFAGQNDWTNYTVEADLVRGSTNAGIWVLAQDSNPYSGIFLSIHPHNETWEWGSWEQSGFKPAKDAWNWFRKPFVAQAQEVLRLFLKTWQYTILIALVLALAALLLQSLLALSPALLKPARLGIIAYPPHSPPAEEREEEPLPEKPASRFALLLPDFDATSFTAAVWLVGVIALFATCAICLIQLEAIPHVQDSVAYYFQAKIFEMGRWYAPAPKFPDAFQHEFVILNDGKWFGKYPPGYPLLLAAGMIARVPWLVNPLLGTGALILTALTGARLFSRRTGLVAAVLGLFSPFFLLLAASFMSHAAGFFCFALAIYLMVRMEQQPDEGGIARWLVPLLAGVAAGWLFITRSYTAVLVLLPFAVYFGITIWRKPCWWRWLIAAAAVIPVIGILLVFNAQAAGSPFNNTWEVNAPYDRIGFALHGIGMRDGHTPSDGLYVVMRNVSELLRDLYGWPLFITLALAFLPFALGAAKRWDWLLLVSAACLIFGYSAYWADGIMYGPRYYYEALPAFLLLTARGIDVVATRADQLAGLVLRRRSAVSGGLLLSGALLILLMALNISGYLPNQIGSAYTYNYTNADRLHIVQNANIHNAVVFVETSAWYAWWDYGSVFPQNDPLLQGDVIYARDLGDARNREVAAAYPGRTFYRITAGKKLFKIDY